jgi:hypothetical protein
MANFSLDPLDVVAHTCNFSYLGGRDGEDREDLGSTPAHAKKKVSETTYQQTSQHYNIPVTSTTLAASVGRQKSVTSSGQKAQDPI